MLWLDFWIFSIFFFFFLDVYSPSNMGSQTRVIFQHHLLDNVGLGLDCAAFQFMIDVKPAPQKKEGERHGLCLARAWAWEEQEATADPRPRGVCGGRLHQIKRSRLGVIWDPAIFIAFRSSCNWFDCREEKQDYLPTVVLVAFLVSFSHTREGFPAVVLPLSLHSNGFIPSLFSSSLVALLHFLFPTCCPFPVCHLFAPGTVGAGQGPGAAGAPLPPWIHQLSCQGALTCLCLPVCARMSLFCKKDLFFNWTPNVSNEGAQNVILNFFFFVREAWDHSTSCWSQKLFQSPGPKLIWGNGPVSMKENIQQCAFYTSI